MRISALATAVMSTLCATGAHAAGFALIEQNASGLGNAYAGQAASAQDASTLFFNAAGLTRVQGRQVVIAGNLIRPSAKLNNEGSTNAPLQPSQGGEGGDAGGWAVVPNLYYAMDVTAELKFGLGVNSPFGLATNYDSDWMGRFLAVKSDMKTINLNPTLAYKVSDKVSVGAGLNAQFIQATLTNKVNYSAVFAQATSNAMIVPNVEGTAKVKGDDWSWGYNLGILFSPEEGTRVGLGYRSRVKYTLEGDVTFSRPSGLNAMQSAILNAAVPNGDVTAKVNLPDTLSISLFKNINPTWDFLADVTWTHWKLFEDLTVKRASGTVLTSTPENWDDTLRYSVGVNYHASDKMTWRAGVAYDETPVSDQFRTPRIPDESRTWLAVGGQYRISKNSAFDFGYAHLFVKDASIDQSEAGKGHLVGSYDNAVDILSVQYTHSF
jgi:long-chain fatty acid transport protein